MRVLQICSARDIGGGERHVADLANALTRRGHSVFAAVNPNAAIIDELHALPRENIVEVRMRGSLDAIAAGRIAGTIRDKKVDLLHAHIARDYPLAALASKGAGNTPFILTRHVLFPLNRLHRLMLRSASRVIAVSRSVADSVRRRDIFDPAKIVTIHNGIEVERFRAKAHRSSALEHLSARSLVGTIGHIAPIKGQMDLMNAFAAIAGERGDVDLVIVGEDRSRDRKNRRELEALVSEAGLQERVHMIGWKDDVAPWLHRFDIFVSAARSEPFGLVILEAMAAGVPVVATASEGALEIIDDGVTGVLVPMRDSGRMAAAMRGLLNDKQKRDSLAANALKAVAAKFSLDSMVDATELVYRETIER